MQCARRDPRRERRHTLSYHLHRPVRSHSHRHGADVGRPGLPHHIHATPHRKPLPGSPPGPRPRTGPARGPSLDRRRVGVEENPVWYTAVDLVEVSGRREPRVLGEWHGSICQGGRDFRGRQSALFRRPGDVGTRPPPQCVGKGMGRYEAIYRRTHTRPQPSRSLVLRGRPDGVYVP